MTNEMDEIFVAVSRHVALRRLGAPSEPPVLRGRYQLHAVVGSGSFGVVYRAWDRVLERFVALKRTRAIDLGEARALAAIRHPNVVTVFDVYQEEDVVEVVMEYLDGIKLRRWVRLKRDDSRALLSLLAKTADGLAAIHDAKLVHADVKPSNIMVVGGEPVIIDLGLARAGRGGATKYLAPEIRAGLPPDAKTDQYSFCLVAKEVVGSRMGRRVARVLRRGLAGDPSERWQDMHELATALHAISRPRRRWVVAALPIAALLLFSRGQISRPRPDGAFPVRFANIGRIAVASGEVVEHARHGDERAVLTAWERGSYELQHFPRIAGMWSELLASHLAHAHGSSGEVTTSILTSAAGSYERAGVLRGAARARAKAARVLQQNSDDIGALHQ
ncbi:serine/threonine-protein kinase [Enhygromyxa salina]|uniref:serine/threonine-protein kinase n=1 Tax=Enhygromyxa salina TaxID=215803 RepID=UPI0011BAB18B|nr:serine/threonine-protein kinase [Enhygromyxa salina]